MSIIYEALKKVEGRDKIKLPLEARKKTLTFILFFLGIAFFAIFVSRFIKKIVFPARFPSVNPQQVSVAENKEKESRIVPKVTDLNMQKGASGVETELPGYMLEGIIYEREAPLAIINGKIVKKGDKIEDWEVISITPVEVELENTKDKTVFKLGL